MGHVEVMISSWPHFTENFEFHKKFKLIFVQNAKVKYKSKKNLLKLLIKLLQEYNFRMGCGCQVWKFLHPAGYKTPLKLDNFFFNFFCQIVFFFGPCKLFITRDGKNLSMGLLVSIWRKFWKKKIFDKKTFFDKKKIFFWTL